MWLVCSVSGLESFGSGSGDGEEFSEDDMGPNDWIREGFFPVR